MAPRKNISRNSAIAKNSCRKREIKAYTRKKHIGNLSILSRRGPVRFETRNKSVLGMLQSDRATLTPDEINLRLRGCRHGTPFRPISPNDAGTDQADKCVDKNVEKMLHEIIELQLTAARLQGKNSLSKIVHRALDFGIQNGIIINGDGPRRGKSRWTKTSSHSLTSVTSEQPKDSGSSSTATVSAWGGRSFFRVGEVIGKILNYLKPPIALSVKKSTLSEDASTQCFQPDASVSQSHLNGCEPNRRLLTDAVNDMYHKGEPGLMTYNPGWNTCSDVSLDTNQMNSSSCSENNSLFCSCGSTNERPVNVNVNIKADYMRKCPPPTNSNDHPIGSEQCYNSNVSNMMDNYDLYNYEKCMNVTKDGEGM